MIMLRFAASLASKHCSMKRVLLLEHVHKCMRKPHFGAVHGAIAGALDHGPDVMVLRVENYALGGRL